MTFGIEKTRMTWLPDGGNIFEDIFFRFDGIRHERDGWTDRHRMTV